MFWKLWSKHSELFIIFPHFFLSDCHGCNFSPEDNNILFQHFVILFTLNLQPSYESSYSFSQGSLADAPLDGWTACSKSCNEGVQWRQTHNGTKYDLATPETHFKCLVSENTECVSHHHVLQQEQDQLDGLINFAPNIRRDFNMDSGLVSSGKFSLSSEG